jgi:hypothetical protein
MGRRTVTSRVHGPPGGLRRSLFYLACGVLLVAAAVGSLGLSYAGRPSLDDREVVSVPIVISGNYTTPSTASVTVDVDPSARYDLYLTVDTTNTTDGEFVNFDVEGYRGVESRYITYTYTYLGSDMVRRSRDQTTGARLETYEMTRNLQIDHRRGEVKLVFNSTSSWFANGSSVNATIDIIEVTPVDQVLLVITSGLQVAAFPVAFAGIFLIWLALMRQLRLIGVQVAPPGRFALRPGFSMRREAAVKAAAGSPPHTGGAS